MSDRPPRLPSLTALRAFEAAARHGALSKAADELAVTPGAIGHQVKSLEEDLGIELLRREGRGLAVTAEGAAGLADLRRGFDALAQGVEAIRAATRPEGITISVAPSFVSLWLIPRLDRFWALHPGVDVRIDTKWGLTDFARDGVDLAIRYGPGGYDPLYFERLFNDDCFAVCSPHLATADRPLDTPADLRHHVLLHVDPGQFNKDWPDWRMWLTAAGVADKVDYSRGSRFYISDLALRAAVQGHGVALSSRPLATDLMRAGRLIQPFDFSLCVDFGYWLVCPPEKLQQPLVRAFTDWLLDAVAEDLAQEAAG